MRYKTLKELRDAGFPNVEELVATLETPAGLSNPTLQELLDACGMGFRSLSLHSDGRWLAKAGHCALPTKKLFVGHNASEALAKLWLGLKAGGM